MTHSAILAFVLIAILGVSEVAGDLLSHHGLLSNNLLSSQHGVTPVRLSGGRGAWEGLVEVLHAGRWGTVCDDDFTNSACKVICRQIGFSGGHCVNEDASNGCLLMRDRNWSSRGGLHQSVEVVIWLVGVRCDGSEASLTDCAHNQWTQVNCLHKEDAGCVCSPNNTVGSLHGGCEKERHRIVPFDIKVPNMGRVEVEVSGEWGVVCDDSWDDIDAAVFCQCLGYQSKQHARALLYPRYNATLPVSFDGVHCSRSDTESVKNLWDCRTTPASVGQCDPSTESAAVMCGHHPSWVKPADDIPEVLLTCAGPILTVCFTPQTRRSFNEQHYSRTTALSPSHFYISSPENCSFSGASQTEIGGVCLNISMSSCSPRGHTKTKESMKQYCYDVTHSKFGRNPYRLLTDSVWTRRLCCLESVDGTITSGSFLPRIDPPLPPVYSSDASSQRNTFSMSCYRDLTAVTDSSTAVRFPMEVSRGDRVACFIEARSWDERLQLVVPECRFMSTADGRSGPSFSFLKASCPTTEDLHLLFYNIDALTWGMSFHVAQFEGYRELYVSCDVRLCDVTRDDKYDCDRSCRNPQAPPTASAQRQPRELRRMSRVRKVKRETRGEDVESVVESERKSARGSVVESMELRSLRNELMGDEQTFVNLSVNEYDKQDLPETKSVGLVSLDKFKSGRSSEMKDGRAHEDEAAQRSRSESTDQRSSSDEHLSTEEKVVRVEELGEYSTHNSLESSSRTLSPLEDYVMKKASLAVRVCGRSFAGVGDEYRLVGVASQPGVDDVEEVLNSCTAAGPFVFKNYGNEALDKSFDVDEVDGVVRKGEGSDSRWGIEQRLGGDFLISDMLSQSGKPPILIEYRLWSGRCIVQIHFSTITDVIVQLETDFDLSCSFK